nr:hypothetical protein [Aphis gossypii nege-like virus]
MSSTRVFTRTPAAKPLGTVVNDRYRLTPVAPKRKRVVSVKQPLVVKQAKRKVPAGFDINAVCSDISSTFSRALGNPLVLCTIVLALGLILTHDTKNKTGYVYDLLKNNTDVVSQWITTNGAKFVGLVIFIPSVLDSPRSYRTVLAFVSFFWVMIIPQSKPVEYFLQSLALHTYFKLRQQSSRMFVLFAVGVAYVMGYFKLN